MKRVEEMAKQLINTIKLPLTFDEYEKIAHHILIREIKARIKDVEFIGGCNYETRQRYIKELTATLKELEGTHDQ